VEGNMHIYSDRKNKISLEELRNNINALFTSIQNFSSCVTGKEQFNQQEIIQRRYDLLVNQTAKRMTLADLAKYNKVLFKAKEIIDREIDLTWQYSSGEQVDEKSQYYIKKFGG
jgi:hypothetical protein